MRALLLVVALACCFAACGGDDPRPQPASPSEANSETSTASQSPSAAATTSAQAAGWPNWTKTDFNRKTIDLKEVFADCSGRDCIPALDAEGAYEVLSPVAGSARFVPAREPSYPGNYPVAVPTLDGETRGYPLHILTWHEIVNDKFGDRLVAMTFCPLCNTVIAFDRRVDGRHLDFGVSGNLRNSDLIMYDRQTWSWWQQATGEGIVGTYAGTKLNALPANVVSMADFVAAFPEARVLSENTSLPRDYGLNPYPGYDTRGSRPFLFEGAVDARMDAMERVLGVRAEGDALAIPFARLSEVRAATITFDGKRLAAFWSPGTASALGRESIARAADVGAAVIYESAARGRSLTFGAAGDGRFRDQETASTWDIHGRALDGPLAGAQLPSAQADTIFWFAWAAFFPKTAIWSP